MKGRKVLKTNITMTLDEFEQFLNAHWDKTEYGDYVRGKPTPASFEEYILLQSTAHTLIAMYPRRGKVVLTVVDNPEGLGRIVFSSLPTNKVYLQVAQNAQMVARAKEFKGPGNDMNLFYAAYLEQLLRAEGLLR